MSLSDLSIRNPVFAVMLSAAMVVFGYLGYRDLGISQFPEIDFPVVSITTCRDAADRLPNDIDPPIISKVNFNKFPVIWLSVHGPRPIRELNDIVDTQLKQQIET